MKVKGELNLTEEYKGKIKNVKSSANQISSSNRNKCNSKEHLTSLFNAKFKNPLLIIDDNMPALVEGPNKIIINDNQELFFQYYLTKSLNEMDFREALVNDDRKFCEHFWHLLKEKHIVINTFFASNPLKSRIMKIILLILNLILYFVINGLFYSEEYISEVFNLEKDTFFGFVPRSIKRFIYTTMVSIIVTFISEFFFIEEKKIKGIFNREKSDKNELQAQMIVLIKQMKKRFITFIIVMFLILLFSFYYLL